MHEMYRHMPYKVFSLLEPGSRKVIEIERTHPKLMRWVEPIGLWIDRFLERDIGLVLDRVETYVHPQEDYLLISKRYPIFVVADGVTLEIKQGAYPVPSGAGKAAQIFCKEVIREAEQIYDNFTEKNVTQVFVKANEAVGEYNRLHGRTKESINFWDFDFFSATAGFIVMRDNIFYWASICDSYVAHFDRNGILLFQSPGCWSIMGKHLPKEWKTMDEEEGTKMAKKLARNKINEKGERIGYGVVTGEKEAEHYLNHGSFSVRQGDFVALFTDGFEPYLRLPEFINLFKDWSNSLRSRVANFTGEKSKNDPAAFAHERSLIIISFS